MQKIANDVLSRMPRSVWVVGIAAVFCVVTLVGLMVRAGRLQQE